MAITKDLHLGASLFETKHLLGCHSQPNDCYAPEKHNNGYWSAFQPFIIEEVKAVVSKLRQTVGARGIGIVSSEGSSRQMFHQPQAGRVKITVQKVEKGGALVTYLTTIGWFSLRVLVLNVDCKVGRTRSSRQAGRPYEELLDSSKGNDIYFLRRIYSLQDELTHEEVLDAISEYAVAYICSALQVGPQLSTRHFNLVCFSNAIQYACEKCQPLQRHSPNQRLLRQRMHYCLRLMHAVGLTHNTISPRSVVYSPMLNTFVLNGFGGCSWLSDGPGIRALSFREGWFKWMGQEMKQGEPGACSLIDLYSNDLFCLQKVLDQTPRQIINNSEGDRQKDFNTSQEGDDRETLFWLEEKLTKKGYAQKPPTASEIQTALARSFPQYFGGGDGTEDSFTIKHHHLSFLERVAGKHTPLLKITSPCDPTDHHVGTAYETFNQATQQLVQQQSRSMLVLQRQLRRLRARGQDHPESFREEVALRLRLATVMLFKNPSQALHEIEEVLKLKNMLVGEIWADGIQWLVQLLQMLIAESDNTTSLPASAKQRFLLPLSQKRQNFILLCAIACYLRDRYQLAASLMKLLVGQKEQQHSQPSTGDHSRCHFLGITEKLFNNTTTQSSRWTILAELTMRSYIHFNQERELVDNYTKLLEYPHLKLDQRALVLQILGFAHHNLKQPSTALSYCRQSLELKEQLPLCDQQVFHKQQLLLVHINETELKDYEQVLRICQHGHQVLGRFNQPALMRLTLQHKSVNALVNLKRYDEAAILYNELKKIVLQLSTSQHQLVDVVRQHLALVALFFRVNDQTSHMNSLSSLLTKVELPTKRVEMSHLVDCYALMAFLYLKYSSTGEAALQMVRCALQTLVCYSMDDQCAESHQQIWIKVLSEQPVSITSLPVCGELIGMYYVLTLLRLSATEQWQQLQEFLEGNIQRCRDLSEVLTYVLGKLPWWLHIRRQSQSALTLLERGQPSLASLFMRNDILMGGGHHRQCVQVLEYLLETYNSYLPSQQLAEIHDQLTRLYRFPTAKNDELAAKHLESACEIYRRLHLQNPQNPQHMLSLGLSLHKAKQHIKAIKPLKKLHYQLRSAPKKEADLNLRLQGLVPLAISLNANNRCRESLYYFLQFIQSCRSQATPECLFYMAHNAYVLRRWRMFTRYSARLYRTEHAQQHLVCLKEFLEGRSQEQRLVVMTGLPTKTMWKGHLELWWQFSQSKDCSNLPINNQAELLTLQKKILRYAMMTNRGETIQASRRRLARLRQAH